MIGRLCRGLSASVAAAGATVLIAGCGGAAASSSAPVTVSQVSASDPAALILSTGQRVYDTGTATGIMLTAPIAGSCERIFNDTLARRVLTGATVTASTAVNRWASAPSGYSPAELTYAEMQGMAMRTMFSHPEVASRRQGACVTSATPTTTTTTATAPPPTTTSEAPSDVDIDVENDDDGESRFCRRHWFC